MLKWLANRNVILFLAIALGIVLPQASHWSEKLMMPALGLAMTLATLSVPSDYFRRFRAMIVPSLAGVAMTYGVLGSVIIGAAALLIADRNVWIGFVLIAAVPPAVAVIPFTAILEGETAYTLSGTVAAYLAALAVMPVVFWVFIGPGHADPVKLLWVMLLLIILPLVLSRLILHFRLDGRINPVRGILTDWSFFIVVYTMIGMNRDLIFSRPLMIAPVAGVVVVGTFLLGWVVETCALRCGADRARTVSLTLLGTLKNQGIAGGLAIALFEKEAALPSAIYSIFMILYILWLDWRHRRRLRRLTA